MQLIHCLDSAIHRHTGAALAPFVRELTQLMQSQGPAKLALINRIILMGPAFSVLHTTAALPQGAEADLIMHEIAMVQRVVLHDLVCEMDTLLDRTLTMIIAPPIPLVASPQERRHRFLEACTDLRCLAFGDMICCLYTHPNYLPELFCSTAAQRALAFAIFIMTDHGIPWTSGGWYQGGALSDPVAWLSGLLALKRAVQRQTLSLTTAERVLTTWESYWVV
jgi:hypothetical protein